VSPEHVLRSSSCATHLSDTLTRDEIACLFTGDHSELVRSFVIDCLRAEAAADAWLNPGR
jgi:hypothetical protein